MKKALGMLVICCVFLLSMGWISDAVASQCFDNCMKPGTKYPGECQLICNNATKQKSHNSSRSNRNWKSQQEQLIRNQLEQQRVWEETKKAREAAERLAAADEAVQDASRVNLMCYRACYIEYQQKVFCEKHCAKKETKVGDGIQTGDVKIDSLIVECYRGCAERDELTPACFHSCCYICNKEKFDDEKGYVENPWLTRCKANCSHKGLGESACEDICLGDKY